MTKNKEKSTPAKNGKNTGKAGKVNAPEIDDEDDDIDVDEDEDDDEDEDEDDDDDDEDDEPPAKVSKKSDKRDEVRKPVEDTKVKQIAKLLQQALDIAKG